LHLPGRIKEEFENLNQNSWHLSPKSNPRLYEYEAGVATTEMLSTYS
jgi:hypothetical protein